MQAKVTYTREADFRRERDFGAKVGATFEFVAAQFRPLVKCVAYFVLPGALLASIGLGLSVNDTLGLHPVASNRLGGPVEVAQSAHPYVFTSAFYVGLSLAVMGFLMAFLLLSGTVYGFVRVRMSIPADEVVQPAQVWAHVWPRLGRVVVAWLLLSVVVVGAMSLVAGALALIWPGFVVLLFFPMIWVVVCLTLYFPILWMEDGGVGNALRRSFYLVKGKWWSSFGLYLVMTMVTGMINYLFLIPTYGLMAARTLLHESDSGLDSQLLSVMSMSIYALGWVFTAVLPLLAMLFQYFNLVERKEGVGLRLLVASLGQTAAPQVSSATYQPDEDGEY